MSLVFAGLLLAAASGCNDTDFAGASPSSLGQLDAPGGDAGNPADNAGGGVGNPGDNGGGGAGVDDHGPTDDHGTGSTDPSVDGRDCTAPTGNEVMICHVPPGNPDARHTICVGLQGAIHGHGLDPNDMSAIGDHGGDTWGACQ